MDNLYLPLLASLLIILTSIIWALRVANQHRLPQKRTLIAWGLLIFGLFLFVALETDTSWQNAVIEALIAAAVVWAYILVRVWLLSRQ